MTGKYEHITDEPYNPFFKLVSDQHVAVIPEFQLESGEVLTQVPVAYKTWGKMNEAGDNVMVICHALTGSADVSDWWGPLLGQGLAFDPSRYFIICINALGSPYGTASPVTLDPSTGVHYGPEFPLTTVKDDAKLQRLILDDLGARKLAAVIGGSMGGMLVLEYAYMGPDYVKCIVPLATCACHSAWGISWGEAQRQSIYSDPKYLDGYYPFDDPPTVGLGAARMAALLTYRSRNSFDSKFGRDMPDPSRHKIIAGNSREPLTPEEERWAVHNHGHVQGRKLSPGSSGPSSPTQSSNLALHEKKRVKRAQTYFTAQSYLRYQAQKFISRFDANCYISITRKLDTHDVARGRADTIVEALALIKQPTLVIGVSSDGLFTYSEQERLAENIPNSKLEKITSQEGHDAFLLEFKEINRLIVDFLQEQLPDIYKNEDGKPWERASVDDNITKNSVFGESETAELEVTSW